MSLAEEGIETHLFVTNRSGQPGEKLLREKFNFKSLPSNLFLSAIQLKGKSNWSFYRTVASAIQQDQFSDAIIITRKHSVLPHLLLAKRKTQKLFFETHDFFFDLSLRNDIQKNSRRKQSIIERLFFKKLDGLICLNRFQKDLYEKRLTIPVSVFQTGFRKPEANNEEKKNQLLYIGALEERKGIENILNLAELLDDDCSIIIIGSRKVQEIKGLQSELEKRGIANRVEVKEWQSKKYLNKLLGQSKIGLLPLKEGYFNEYLTVPLKYFDYASFGLPVVGSDFPSLSEYIRDGYNGYLVDWSDLSQVKEKIDGIVSDESKWQTFSDNQVLASENLTWQRRAKDQIEFFKRLSQK